MLKNYFLVTLRNLRANKLFSIINIAGLAIGLSACFLIWQYVRFESSYDGFHENKDHLYRVNTATWENGDRIYVQANTFGGTAHAMKEELPEVKDFCRLMQTSLYTSDLGRYVANALEFSRVDRNGKPIAFIEESVWFADPGLLTMFSFPITEGTQDALTAPNSIVLTKSMARKYFGDEPALGQELRLNSDMMLNVTAVLEDVPANSHLQFDVLISFSTMRPRLGDMYEFGWVAYYNYVLLNANSDADAVRAKLPDLKDKYISWETDSPRKTAFELQPITNIHLTAGIAAEQSPGGNERTVYFLSILAVFILVVAWINYINLSTSKALQRSKEVGLRKTVGATKTQLITQFLLDTIVVNILSLAIATGIVVGSWSAFEQLVGKQISDTVFTGGFAPWAVAVAVFFAGVIICGVYPAIALSSFNPAVVLKGGFVKSSSGAWLRKVMVSFQYVLAVLLIAGTVTIYLQLSYMRSLDTGFTKEQVVIVDAPAVFDSTAASRITYFRNELMKMPGVRNVSATSDVPGRYIVEGSGIGPIQGERKDFFVTSIAAVDTSFFKTFGIKLLAGRMFEAKERMAFRKQDEGERIPMLVNETFIKHMALPNIEALLEKELTFWWGPEQRFARIIGVVADHHQVSLKEALSPISYMQPEWLDSKYFATRVETGSSISIDKMQAAYASAFPGHPFNYFFLDDHFDKQYREDQRFGDIFNTFTVLAIIVTCMGLLGLSIFSVAQRTKEVSIRKVLGAPASAILFLFSLDFIRALLISYAIAIPIIYWAGHNWLQNYSTRIPLRWEIFATPLILLVTITLITVLAVSIKAMVEAPVKALRQV